MLPGERSSRREIRADTSTHHASRLHAVTMGTAVAPSSVRVGRMGGNMDAIVPTAFFPSLTLLAAAAGTIVVAVGALLLQKAARTHLHEQRCDRLRKHVARAEAQWHEAAM